jgi:hypothetical protein
MQTIGTIERLNGGLQEIAKASRDVTKISQNLHPDRKISTEKALFCKIPMNTSISKSFDLGLFGRFQTTISVPTAWI